MRYTGRSNSFHNPLVTFLTFLSNWSRLPGGNNGDIIWSDNPTKTKGPRFQSMSSISSSGTFDHALRRRHVALVGSCRIVVSSSLSNCFSRLSASTPAMFRNTRQSLWHFKLIVDQHVK